MREERKKQVREGDEGKDGFVVVLQVDDCTAARISSRGGSWWLGRKERAEEERRW